MPAGNSEIPCGTVIEKQQQCRSKANQRPRRLMLIKWSNKSSVMISYKKKSRIGNQKRRDQANCCPDN